MPSARAAATTTAIGHPFDTDTAVTDEGAGTFSAVLTDRWDRLGGGPLGGYSMATCLRALRRVMPFPDPIVVSAFFLRPAVHGAAHIETEVVRTGRTVATGEARLHQDGREVLRLVGTFTNLDAAIGQTLMLGQPPALPAPESCIDPLEGRPVGGATIAERVEYRYTKRPGWAHGAPSGDPTIECWLRFKEQRDADAITIALLVDAVTPAVMEIGALGSSTVEMTVHLRARPRPGWLACRIATRHVIGGFHEEDFEVWDSGGNLVAQSRQLAVMPNAR